MAIDVFISYHAKTSLSITKSICHSLESQGIQCWYFSRDSIGAYASKIVAAIKACKIFVLILNQESSYSEDVLNEINLAVERIRNNEKLVLLPFRISDEPLNDAALYYIGRIHWIDATIPPVEKRIEELTHRITLLLADMENNGLFIDNGRYQISEQINRLQSNPLFINNHFLCRTRELEILHNSLIQYNKIFIQGMGGIGKSELARAYAVKSRACYSTVIFAVYESNLMELLINDSIFNISCFGRNHDQNGIIENDESYFNRKLKKIKELSSEKTLIIIDNFDVTDDPHLEAFLNGFYTVIFTTRNNFDYLGLPTLELSELEPETEQIELFLHYYKRPLLPKYYPLIRQILNTVQGHTLAVELIAKLMFSKRISPEKMLLLLQQSGITPSINGTIQHGFEKSQTIYDNILSLFHIYDLSENERFLLTNLALVPANGFELESFAELCELEDCLIIDELINKSWIRHDIHRDTISLHPLIRDVVINECHPSLDKCHILIHNLTGKLNAFWGDVLDYKLLYGELAKSIYKQFPEVALSHIDFYIAMATAFSQLEMFEQGKHIIKNVIMLYKETYHKDTLSLAMAYYHLGNFRLLQNDYESGIPFINEALEITKRLAPDSTQAGYLIKYFCWYHLNTSSSFTNYLEIEHLLQKSYHILQKYYPEKSAQIASQYAAFALVYYKLENYELALYYAEQAYHIFYELYGELHGDTIAPMTTKALILSKTGKAEEGITLLNRVIGIQKKLCGEYHYKVLTRYEYMAEIYENCGRFQESAHYLQLILDILKIKDDIESKYYDRITEELKKLQNYSMVENG